ncbi:MAG: hypothetical protein HQL56_11150 [Magnetococcales bacterium]|nr:hypothetical protein [Magnetococcales bacterium]
MSDNPFHLTPEERKTAKMKIDHTPPEAQSDRSCWLGWIFFDEIISFFAGLFSWVTGGR